MISQFILVIHCNIHSYEMNEIRTTTQDEWEEAADDRIAGFLRSTQTLRSFTKVKFNIKPLFSIMMQRKGNMFSHFVSGLL